MRRPCSSPAGRAGISPPSHHVTLTSGIPSRAGNLKRVMVDRGNISFLALVSTKNCSQNFETLASTLIGYFSFSAQNSGSTMWQAMSPREPVPKSHQARHFAG